MDPPETRRYLRAVERALRDLGPFERHRALKEVRGDLIDFAMDGAQTWPSSERLGIAARAMPPPAEVARSYLANARPPALAIRLSLLLNLLLCLGPLVLGILTFTAVVNATSGGGGLTIPILLGSAGLVVLGSFGVVVYGVATAAPAKAIRWRYAVLPAAAIAVVVDFVWSVVLMVGWGAPALLVLILAPAWGAYNVGYSHGELPRLAPDAQRGAAGDYFRALSRALRDVDLARRRTILEELRSHLAASGIDPTSLSSAQRRAAIEKVLGPPEAIAARYLEAGGSDAGAHRRTEALALVAVTVGIALSILVLGSGLAPSWGPAPAAAFTVLTVLGLLGSAGLLVFSVAALAGLIQVRRAPMTWPDAGPPTKAFALVVSLLLAAVVGGAVSGGITSSVPAKAFAVGGTYSAPDGSLGAFWTQSSVQEGIFQGSTGPAEGAWLTRLDANRNVLGTEPYPFNLRGSPLLALREHGGTWEALFADSFTAWGSSNVAGGLDVPAGWGRVVGQLNDTSATIVWSNAPSSGGTLSLRYESLDTPFMRDVRSWDRTHDAPGWQDVILALGEDRVLAVPTSWERNDTYVRAEVRAFLLDTRGNAIANATLFQANVTRNGPNDSGNATGATVAGAWPVAGGFWVLGTSSVAVNGTETDRSWATLVRAADGSTVTQELHRFVLPASHFPERPGDRSLWIGEVATGRPDGVLVASSVIGWSVNESLYHQIDPSVGGLFVTGLRADGSTEFQVRLRDAGAGDAPLWPLLAAWGGDPIVLVPHFFDSPGPDVQVDAYEVPAPARAITRTALGVRRTALSLFYVLSAGISGTGRGVGVGPGLAEFAGQVTPEDCGLFGWRRIGNPDGCWFAAPGLVRIDVRNRTTAVVLLGPAAIPPDTVGQLTVTFAATVLLVAAVRFGYPRLRARRERPARKGTSSGPG